MVLPSVTGVQVAVGFTVLVGYGQDILKLVHANGYLTKLLDNEAVIRYTCALTYGLVPWPVASKDVVFITRGWLGEIPAPTSEVIASGDSDFNLQKSDDLLHLAVAGDKPFGRWRVRLALAACRQNQVDDTMFQLSQKTLPVIALLFPFHNRNAGVFPI